METTRLISTNELTSTEAAVAGGFLGGLLAISLVVGVLLIIAGWKIFEKAGEKGWKILIPVYDLYILFKICGIKNWFWGFVCISIICSIMMAVNTPTEIAVIEDWSGVHMDYSAVEWGKYPWYLAGIIISCAASVVVEAMLAAKLAKAFGKSVWYGVGIFFFPYIFTLILGFGKAKYSAKKLNK